jgi:hypothetical protein
VRSTNALPAQRWGWPSALAGAGSICDGLIRHLRALIGHVDEDSDGKEGESLPWRSVRCFWPSLFWWRGR